MSDSKVDLSDMVCFISPRAGYDQGRLTLSFTIDGMTLYVLGQSHGDVFTEAQKKRIIHVLEERLKKGMYDR